MGANDVNGPVQQVQVIGGASQVNIPLDFYSVYVQDDWRTTSRLTLNLGVRYDYVTEHADQPGQQPELRGHAGRGRGGPLRGNGAR